jgi:hypothetical protein
MFYPFSIRNMRATCPAHLTHPHVLMTPLIFQCSFSRPVTGLWTTGEKKAKFGYDYWYQPYLDVMISSEWAAPKSFKKGFSLPDTQDEGSAQDSKHAYASGSASFRYHHHHDHHHVILKLIAFCSTNCQSKTYTSLLSDMLNKIMILCLVTPCILVYYHQLSQLPRRQLRIRTSPSLLLANNPLHNDNIPWMLEYSTTPISG